MTRNRLIATGCRSAIGGILIYLIITRFSVGAIVQNIRQVDTTLFLQVAVAYGLANVFVVVRWYLIMRSMEMKIHFFTVVKSYLVGIFFNLFLPTSIGGDVVKAYYISRKVPTNRMEKTLFSVFFDRYLGFLVMLGVGSGCSLFLEAELAGVSLSPLLFALLLILFTGSVVLVVYAERIDQVVERVHVIKKRFSHSFQRIAMIVNVTTWDKKLLMGILICGVANLLMLCFMHYIFIERIGKVSAFLPLLVFVPVVIVVTMVPISINGIGVRELSYVTLFTTLKIDPSISIAMSLFFYSIMFLFSLPGGIVSLEMIASKKELTV